MSWCRHLSNDVTTHLPRRTHKPRPVHPKLLRSLVETSLLWTFSTSLPGPAYLVVTPYPPSYPHLARPVDLLGRLGLAHHPFHQLELSSPAYARVGVFRDKVPERVLLDSPAFSSGPQALWLSPALCKVAVNKTQWREIDGNLEQRRTIEMQLSSVASARFTLPCVSPSPPCPRQTMLRHSRTPKSMQFQFCPYKLRLFSGSQALPTSAMYIAPDGSRKTALARVAELPDVRMVSLQRGISFLERSPASSCA